MQKVSEKGKLNRISSLSFVLLLATSPFLVGNHLVLPLEASDSSKLSSGDYAYYTESNLSLAYLAGWLPVSGPAGRENEVSYLDFKTQLPFSSLTVGWQIESVQADSYLVNYTVVLVGLSGQGQENGRLSESILVSRVNNTAYWVNGTAFGTWPYWLADSYRAPGATITLVHRVPIFGSSLNDTNSLVYLTEEAFTSLPQGVGLPNRTATKDFLDSSLNLGPQGTFLTDRLLVTYPFFRSLNSPGAHATFRAANAFWVGVYDRFSGILLAQDHDGYFIDDVLLHSGLGVWQVGFSAASLTLHSTDLNLGPDSKPGQSNIWIAALVVLALVGTFIVASTLTVHRRSRKKVR